MAQLFSLGKYAFILMRIYLRIRVIASDRDEGARTPTVIGTIDIDDLPRRGDRVAVGSDGMTVTEVQWAPGRGGGSHVPFVCLEKTYYPSESLEAILRELMAHLHAPERIC